MNGSMTDNSHAADTMLDRWVACKNRAHRFNASIKASKGLPDILLFDADPEGTNFNFTC